MPLVLAVFAMVFGALGYALTGDVFGTQYAWIGGLLGMVAGPFLLFTGE